MSAHVEDRPERPYVFAALTILIGLVVTSGLLFWSSASPEAMVIGLDGRHDGAADRLAGCLDCHVPFVGAPPSRCLSPGCHGALATGTPPRDGKAMPVRFHATLRQHHCSDCHTEHGKPRRESNAAFSHDIIPKEDTHATCDRCHSGRRIPSHPRTDAVDCARCHNTNAWTGRKVDHAKVSKFACDVCHSAPATPSHVSIAGACGTCHGLSAWLPALNEVNPNKRKTK